MFPKCPEKGCGGNLVPFSGSNGQWHQITFAMWKCTKCEFTMTNTRADNVKIEIRLNTDTW